MTREPDHRVSSALQAQVDRLAPDLRRRGHPPERDLWPDIARAIAAAEERRYRRAGPVPWHRWAAVAAAVGILVWGAWQGAVPVDRGQDGPPAVVSVQGGSGPLAVVDRALDEVTAALHADPGNRSLAQIAVMLHRSRGRLLLQNGQGTGRDM